MKKAMDGNMAAAHISYAFSEIAAIYPITPSSPMAEYVDEWQAQGRKNIWGEPLKIVEMQSEAGAAGSMHGSLKAGALTSSYTASQGLLLMIPNMYKMAGELLPGVLHVAARAVSTNALNIFGDHSDVMSARATGFIMLAESSVQEVMDLSAVAHLTAIEASIPVMNFFDGFDTSHEIQKIDVIDYDDLAGMINQDKLAEFRQRAMNPDHPTVSGTNQNPDIHFQQRETLNPYYDAVPTIMKKYMAKINELRGTNYDLVDYYGVDDAEEVIISMGSVAGTIIQTVDYLNQQGRKVGFLNLHLFRPFPADDILAKLPSTVKSVAVLDRTKEPGSHGEPLLLDVQSAMFEAGRFVRVIGGRYGLGSKNTEPKHIKAVFDELQVENAKKRFTIAIKDDVTNLSLQPGEDLDLTPATTYQAKFWGFGSDGTVGANKSAIKIIGNHTDKYVQGQFTYDSKKSGGLTVSHLRFGETPILSEYLVSHADFVAVHAPSYLRQYDLLKDLKPGGIFLLNTIWDDEELNRHLPWYMKKAIAEKNIQFYTLNAVDIAQQVGLGRRINTAMQVAFFKLTNIMPFDQVLEILKEDAHKSYAKKSMAVVEKNWKAMDLAAKLLHKVDYPAEWAELEAPKKVKTEDGSTQYVFKIVNTVNRQEGDSLSTGDLIDNKMADGSMPLGTTAVEKRGIALEVPEWDAEFCTMCNNCSFVCPHAAIRPFLLDEDERNKAPEGYIVRDFRGKDGLLYRIQVSVEDCTGCGLCVEACPMKDKALKMRPYEEQKEQAINWAFSMTLREKENPAKAGTVLGTQFNKPLLEFSGACSGCGETPYVKLLTQMYGDRMMISNATGCSSIWGGAAPVSPYTTNQHGYGPAWSNSLLEDSAEFGYGMYLASQARREKLAHMMEAASQQASEDLQNLMQDWVEHIDTSEGTRARAEKLKALLKEEKEGKPALEEIYELKDQFVKPSHWIVGGDGWAYDIGYGGLDHVIASGANVNLLVLDNEVYSNTGGQVSKGTPASAIAKFAADGKSGAKKDLGMMAMTYGNVYVAQIASGANELQTIKAFEEAERHNGPSVIIAYTPCIVHGIAGGMSQTLKEAKEAVESGYWQLYRYNPTLVESGKNPMTLDYKRPDFTKMEEFMLQQTRFASLKRVHPDTAQALYDVTVQDARRKFESYAKMSGDLEKFLKREATKQGKTLEVSTDGKPKRERKEKVKDPEREARRLARRAERQARREGKDLVGVGAGVKILASESDNREARRTERAVKREERQNTRQSLDNAENVQSSKEAEREARRAERVAKRAERKASRSPEEETAREARRAERRAKREARRKSED